MKSLWKWAVVTSATAMLVACGGGGGDGPISVAVGNPSFAVDSTNGANAVQAMAQAITFPNGVPDFGTSGSSTTLAITASPLGTPPPSFAITAGSSTASGDLTFGSCIFTVKSSTFAAGSKLATGAKVTVSNCSLLLNINGAPATGTPVSATAVLTLNTVSSNPYKITVVITPQGQVMVNGLTVYNIKVTPLTGA